MNWEDKAASSVKRDHDRNENQRAFSFRSRPFSTFSTAGVRLSYRTCRHGTPPVTANAVTCPSSSASCAHEAYTRCTPIPENDSRYANR